MITIILLQQGVYPFEYMIGKKFNETSLANHFVQSFNMEDVTDADYTLAKRICKDFETKNLVEYHDLYVQSNTLLSADVFENSRNTCIEIYELDPAKFLPALGLA